MVDQQNGDVVPVCQSFENTDVPVVAGVGIGLAARTPDALERVDDHQTSGRVLPEELLDLLHQPAAELLRHHGEVQRGRRVLGEVKEAALDALKAVLQTEIEHLTRADGEIPEGLTLGYPKAQPQGQPGLADFRSSRQQVESLGQQVIHHKGRRLVGDAQQSIRVDGIQLFHIDLLVNLVSILFFIYSFSILILT